MGHHKTRKQADLAKLEMTPMIDVVFQLLIFFIVTMSEQDVLAALSISRPQAQQVRTDSSAPLLQITIHKDGGIINGQPLNGARAQEQLSARMARLASFDPNVSVVIKSTNDAPHAKLIETLNICAREEMSNIAVFSL